MGDLTREQIQHALLNVPALVAEEIHVRQIFYPSQYSTLFELKTWPYGTATSKKQVQMTPNLPPPERDFKKWRDISGAESGCDGCPPVGCVVNASKIGGHAFTERVTGLMERDLETEEFCIENLQNTADVDALFTQIVDNISTQVAYLKEQSIAVNYMSQISTKLVVDSDGVKGNLGNQFNFPDLGDSRISKANADIFSFLYSIMSRLPDMKPSDMNDGKPMFNALISQELLSDVWRSDPEARKDLHYSSYADELITKLAPTMAIRGEFIPFINHWPRRFILTGTNNTPTEIIPIASDIRGDAGFYADINPEYFNATHESVLLYPMTPITVFTRGNMKSLPGGMKFGDVPSFFEFFQFNNLQDKGNNRWQSAGFLQSKATIGLDYEHASAMYEVLFERKPTKTLASFHKEPEELPTPVTVDNSIPTTGCQCPQIKSVTASPLDNGHFFVSFHRAIEADAADVLQLGLLRGGFVLGTVVDVSPDGRMFEVTFPAGTTIKTCSKFTSLFCVNNLLCSSKVLLTSDCRSGFSNSVDVYLEKPLKAYTSGQTVNVVFKDKTTADMVLTQDADLEQNIWTLRYAAGFGPTDNSDGSGSPTTLNDGINCDRGGIDKVCVPTATVAACAGCVEDEVVVTGCADDEE